MGNSRENGDTTEKKDTWEAWLHLKENNHVTFHSQCFSCFCFWGPELAAGRQRESGQERVEREERWTANKNHSRDAEGCLLYKEHSAWTEGCFEAESAHAASSGSTQRCEQVRSCTQWLHQINTHVCVRLKVFVTKMAELENKEQVTAVLLDPYTGICTSRMLTAHMSR